MKKVNSDSIEYEKLPFDTDDEPADDFNYIEEEIDVGEFIVEEIQESKQQLATLIREYKNTENSEVNIEEKKDNTQLAKPNNTAIAISNGDVPPSFDDDFNFVRQNMIKMAKDGMVIMEDLMDFARSSQHPQMYRELTNTLKEVTVINKGILELHKTKKEIENLKDGGDPQIAQQNTQNNFYGTKESILEMIARQNAAKTVSGDN